MNLRKIKNMNLSKKMPPKTRRQLEANQGAGIKAVLSGRLEKHYFPKGHLPHNTGKKVPEKQKEKQRETIKKKYEKGQWSHFKGKHHTEESKIKQSMKKTGKKLSPEVLDKLTRRLILNPPMRNPLVKLKHQEKANAYGLTRRKKIEPIVLNAIIERFNSGDSITRLAKDYKIERSVLTKVMKRNGVIINPVERLRLYSKTNPNIVRTQFKEVIK